MPTKLPLSPTAITTAQPLYPTSATTQHYRPQESISQPPTARTKPLHYRAATPPKYHRNTDPRKFVMSYEAIIASAGGDKDTLAKSLFISLEGAATNWYSRLPPGCVHSWPHLKEKFLLNFQGRFRRRFSLLHPARERDTPRFQSKVPTTKSAGPRGVRRPGHHPSNQSPAG
jgi:hypothetical protein